MEHQNCSIDQTATRTFPPQHQNRQPGLEYQMDPHPISECAPSSRKLTGRTALITGGDSGIGRAVAYAFVKEGAKVAIAYYNEDQDAQETAEHIRQLGGECLLLRGDLRVPAFAKSCVDRTVERFGGLDILVNNHAVQFIQRSILDISREQLSLVFQNNVYSFFYLIQAALPHLHRGSAIINTTSVTAYQGHKRGHRRTHPLSGAVSGRAGNPGKCRSSRPNLDSADSRVLFCGGGTHLRLRHIESAHAPGRSALRGSALLCVPGLGRLQLHDRTGAPSQRRHHRGRLNRIPRSY